MRSQPPTVGVQLLPAKCSSYCGVQLNLWGCSSYCGVQLNLWGCGSYCGGAAHTVGAQLILWGCSLYCGGTAHSASVCPTYLYFSHPVLCRQWFSVACQRSHNSDSQGVIVKAVKSMIPDTITIVSSRWVTSWFRHLVYQHPTPCRLSDWSSLLWCWFARPHIHSKLLRYVLYMD